VKHEAALTWLVVRRNDLELKFPLNDSDCQHFVRLLAPKSGSVLIQDLYSGAFVEAERFVEALHR